MVSEYRAGEKKRKEGVAGGTKNPSLLHGGLREAFLNKSHISVGGGPCGIG